MFTSRLYKRKRTVWLNLIAQLSHKATSVFRDVLFLFVIWLLYIESSHLWVGCGGWRKYTLVFELPFVFIVFMLFYFPNIKKRSTRVLIAFAPVLALYIIFDVVYYHVSRSARLSDIKTLAVFFDFAPFLSMSGALVIVLGFLGYGVFIWNQHEMLSRRALPQRLSLRFVVLLLLAFTVNLPVIAFYHSKYFKYFEWSQESTIKLNGRISSVIFYNNLERRNRTQLTGYANLNINVNQLMFPGHIQKQKNIYYVVLESFLDPRRIVNASFNRNPLANEFSDLLAMVRSRSQFSITTSPVYGGGTAQAEFEILTGIPALAKLDSQEFNVLTEKRTSGFLSKCKDSGYSTTAILASNDEYYNSTAAYKALGFDRTIFLENERTFVREKNVKRIFDGDLFEYSLDYALNRPKKTRQFIYILGMYGHFPYEVGKPEIISSSINNENFQRIANQFYYRTQSLSQYLKRIIEADPLSVIFVTSDHLPPILNNDIQYAGGKYENISLLIIDGKQVDIAGKHYYEIPWIVWDYLSDQERIRSFANMEDVYFKLLSESAVP